MKTMDLIHSLNTAQLNDLVHENYPDFDIEEIVSYMDLEIDCVKFDVLMHCPDRKKSFMESVYIKVFSDKRIMVIKMEDKVQTEIKNTKRIP